jgi:hypothetical protein
MASARTRQKLANIYFRCLKRSFCDSKPPQITQSHPPIATKCDIEA